MKRSNLFFHIKTDRVSKKILLDVKFNHFLQDCDIFFRSTIAKALTEVVQYAKNQAPKRQK